MPFWPCADTAAIVVECSVAFFLMARQGLLFEESIGLLRKKVDTIYILANCQKKLYYLISILMCRYIYLSQIESSYTMYIY